MNSTKELILKHNLKLTKSLGQNFLIDEGVLKRIVDAAETGPGDLVIEVGAGIGNMTRLLASRAGRVLAVEVDRRLIPALSENIGAFDKVTVINDDILKIDLKKTIESALEDGFKPRTVKTVSNLPFYITTPIILKFLMERAGIDTMIFMVQKEVAERMAAQPGGKDYGMLSIAVQYHSVPKVLFTVPPHCFIPRPDVDSAVIRLDMREKPPVKPLDEDLFFKTVKAAFGQRRKTLLNALHNSGLVKKGKDELREILSSAGIEENSRGETLSIMQFARLADAIYQKDC